MAKPRIVQRTLAKLRGYPTVESLRRAGASVGEDVWMGRWTKVDMRRPELLKIGADSIIAPGAVLLTHDASMKLATGYARVAEIQIGERVFVGFNAIVLPGTVIGDGAIIGAGAVVRGIIPPGAMMIGNPAQQVGSARDFAARHEARRSAAPDDYAETKTGARPGAELEPEQ